MLENYNRAYHKAFWKDTKTPISRYKLTGASKILELPLKKIGRVESAYHLFYSRCPLRPFSFWILKAKIVLVRIYRYDEFLKNKIHMDGNYPTPLQSRQWEDEQSDSSEGEPQNIAFIIFAYSTLFVLILSH